MKLKVAIGENEFDIDTSAGHDISIPLQKDGGVKSWYVDDVDVFPFTSGDYIGSIKEGSAVNFMNIRFNLHGNGTHTECMAHIADVDLKINEVLTESMMVATLISVTPETVNKATDLSQPGDELITLDAIRSVCPPLDNSKALIIRTLPNHTAKRSKTYSGTNPPYFEPESIQWIVDQGIDHILVDLPSLDREDDGGKVSSHHTFWNYPNEPQSHRTITELIYVADHIAEGQYILNLQLAPIALDASPSRPVLYPIN